MIKSRYALQWIGGINAMEYLRYLFVFLACHSAAVAAHEIDEPDSLRLELNPHDYVPLAVGNRWTYEHRYANDTYPGRESDHLNPFEIPGYPHGRDNPVPPASLTHVERRLTIEITHTEMIDGFEYYVFSGANYSWPPLPEFFWGGKKVRLSDEGFLVFRWDEKDISVYELSHHHLDDPFGNKNGGFRGSFISRKSLEINFDIDRHRNLGETVSGTDDPPFINFSSGEVYISGFAVGLQTNFLNGFGLAEHGVIHLGLGTLIDFSEMLFPVSANIEGEEITFPHFGREFYIITFVQPTSWGKLKRSFLGTK